MQYTQKKKPQIRAPPPNSRKDKRRFQHKELQNIEFQSNRDDVHYNKYRKNHTSSRKMGYTQQTRKKRKLQDSPPKKMSIQDRNKEAMKLSGKLENKADNYVLVADFVKKFRDGIIRLKENKVTNNLQIRICELDDTMFLGENYRLESWGEVYLSKPTKLEILGLLESSQGMALFPQCIVLVGEERHIYCYRNEVLYLFANSLKELLQDGVPNIDTYYDYPDDISDEEEEVLQNDKEVQRLRQVTKEFIDKDADEFNDFYAQFIL
ncbi:uncharacterized protein [Aquarana catesbeiana]|uniref:uncharacterized protein n=1 Tax=Aquarana catesbeiana TaxID=8400 RepID=UPI003CC9FB04